MNLNFRVHSESDLNFAIECEAKEVSIPINGLSKTGGIDHEEALKLSKKAKAHNLDVVFCCDKLVENATFPEFFDKIIELSNFGFVFISDLGSASKLNEMNIPFHLSLEIGSANQQSIETWQTMFPSMKRISLNNQMSKEDLHPCIQKASCETELLVLGQILLYYSPRKLLSAGNIEQNKTLIQSDDAGPSSFPFEQHDSGAVMYYSKALNLLPYYVDFSDSNTTSLRIHCDFLTSEMRTILKKCLKNKHFDDMKQDWPGQLLHGYYGSNKSDSVFKHLPKRPKDQSRLCVAEVIDFDDKHLLIRALSKLSLGDSLEATDSKKREFTWSLEHLSNLEEQTIKNAKEGDLVFIKRIRTLLNGTYIYRI